MSGISAIYFLDRKGKPIIFRNYRGEVVQDISEVFQSQVLELEESNMKPTFTIENVHYCWMKHQNIYSKNKTKSKFFLIIKSIFRFIKQKRFPNNKHNIVVSEINYLAHKNRINYIYETWMKYQKDNVFLSLNSFFLNWRLIENTKNKYNFLIFQENGKDVGFGIINIKNSLCYLVELIIVDENCTNAILNSIINFTHQKNNISALSYLGNIKNKYNLTIFNAIKNAGVEPKELKEMKFVIKNHSNNINFENIDKYILNALWTEGFKI